MRLRVDLRLLLAATLLMQVGLAGCAAANEEEAGAGWVEVVVPRQQMLDLEYTLESGSELSWVWESSAPVAFQALYVNGTAAYPLASEYGLAGEGERQAPRSGRYDLTWDNQRPENVTVRFIVPDGATQRMWPPGGGGPGCPPATLLARVC